MMNDRQHYGRSFLMALLSRVSMYVLMYAMDDRWANVFSNVNQFYMAGLMAAPMIIIEIAVMSGMYRNRTWNLAILADSAVAALVSFVLIRQQTAVGDRQFSAIDDSSPRGSNSDVSASSARGSRDQALSRAKKRRSSR
jgi:hypothetical protein